MKNSYKATSHPTHEKWDLNPFKFGFDTAEKTLARRAKVPVAPSVHRVSIIDHLV
jgi:hypothetical protein